MVTLLLAACSTTKTLVAAAGRGGTSGAVSVGRARAAVLDAPLTIATVDTRGNIDKAAVTQEEIQRTFGEALAAQPPKPLSFTLFPAPLTRSHPIPTDIGSACCRRLLSVKPSSAGNRTYRSEVGTEANNDRLSLGESKPCRICWFNAV
jgi:hypothetical protein